MTRYLEDMSIGSEMETAGRTITEADIVAFAGVSGDFNPLHVNEEWARTRGFGGRIAHGLLVTVISVALRCPEMDDLEVLAFLEECRSFTSPVFPGDTITATWRVEENRRSRSQPDRGILRLAIEVTNQDDTVVQAGHDVLMVAARPEGIP